jgi:hypothetical protein
MRMGAESTAESLSSESEKKEKTAHPTTDNANVTDVEAEAANSLARASASGDYRLVAFFHQRVQFLLDKAEEVFVVSAHREKKLKMKKQKNILKAILPVLGCLTFLPQMQALSPPPDGCYPNFTTAEGCNALKSLTTGAGNTGVGWYALFGTSTGSFNTGIGDGALALNNEDSNTAVGTAALLLNTAGTENSALGTGAMVNNDTGINNTAVGAFALTSNIDGSSNTAVGVSALFSHRGTAVGNPTGASGGFNNAVGVNALFSDETGTSNNAFGFYALFSNISGSNNTAVGGAALQNSTGDYNTALGARSGTDPDIGSNNIYIGDPGVAGDENVISIGGIAASGTDYENTYIGGIFGTSVAGALPVYVNADGHLGTNPVNGGGKKVRIRSPQGVQPQATLKEFQKQQKRIAELESTVARLAATVKDQAAQIEKVSAQVELRKPARRVVVNKQ